MARMNRRLDRLKSYPFERMQALLRGVDPKRGLSLIDMSFGEPKHRPPVLVRRAIRDHLDGLGRYPATRGDLDLRVALASWLKKRHGLRRLDPETQVLPLNGTREGLFSLAQAVIDPKPGVLVVMANPCYQIYEGAARLAGAEPYFVDGGDFARVPASVWRRCQLLYVCSPDNPTGRVLDLGEWRALFRLADRYKFVIASDECYSEIYNDEKRPPLGALAAARKSARPGYRRLVAMGSLSKRSSCPGLRSGFAAGDAEILAGFLKYRTYHGSAMPPVTQAASAAAWRDEAHVEANRRLYSAKFAAVAPILRGVLDFRVPEATFYLWAGVPGDDVAFARRLYKEAAVRVLPGSFLSRPGKGRDPGKGLIRISLVPSVHECVEAAHRIRSLVKGKKHARA